MSWKRSILFSMLRMTGQAEAARETPDIRARDETKYSAEWIDYIHCEVKNLCEAKGWRTQIRRKWCVRECPVANDTVSDLEWKLLPAEQPTAEHFCETDGNYYVLSYVFERHVFVFQHSTIHVGMDNPAHDVMTYSEIQVPALDPDDVCFHSYFDWKKPENPHPDGIPPTGWLGFHLRYLTDKFAPNRFWCT